jgi:hypothetical protein
MGGRADRALSGVLVDLRGVAAVLHQLAAEGLPDDAGEQAAALFMLARTVARATEVVDQVLHHTGPAGGRGREAGEGRPSPAGRATTPCPVCDLAVATEDPEDPVWCDGCGALLHDHCYWGRVASLEEWRAYRTWLAQLPAEIGDEAYGRPVLCPSCRAKGA